MKISNSICLAMTIVCCASYFSVRAQENPKPWSVPEAAKKVRMPIKADTEALSIGKEVYAKHCKSCHGKNGEGDGTKAAELKTFPGDFTDGVFRAQSEAEMFYKTSEGRDDMPSFKKKIADPDDIWAVVVYIRSMKK